MTTLSRPPADPSAPRPRARTTVRNWLLFGLQDSKGTHQGPGGVPTAHEKKREPQETSTAFGARFLRPDFCAARVNKARLP